MFCPSLSGSRGRITAGLLIVIRPMAGRSSKRIYAEMNVQESERDVTVLCHGPDVEPFSSPVRHPEAPGDYYFPPLASLITSGARLMLALLENCVAEAGGTYAMEDTDSMAIVANEHGGLVPCPGGPHRMAGGREAVRALSWEHVRNIALGFKALSPYGADAIPGSILKIEDDHFDPATKRQRQLYCFAISAKRYALFVYHSKGAPVLLRNKANNAADRWSEHGLGHLRNPNNPESDDSAWTAQVWLALIRRALRLPVRSLPFSHLPAIGRISVSSPGLLAPFCHLEQRQVIRSANQTVQLWSDMLCSRVRPSPGCGPDAVSSLCAVRNGSAAVDEDGLD